MENTDATKITRPGKDFHAVLIGIKKLFMGKPFQNKRMPAFWPAWHTAKNGTVAQILRMCS
jgi:hypothetical protein